MREVRVRGAMIGVELSIEGAATVKAAWTEAVVNCTHGTVIRLLPAMNLTEEQAHEGCDILADVLKEQAGNHLPAQSVREDRRCRDEVQDYPLAISQHDATPVDAGRLDGGRNRTHFLDHRGSQDQV